MIIYKDYDKKALDWQYNNRARAADFGRIVQYWEERSTELRKRAPVLQNIRYGPKERELLDIIPATRPGSPIEIFFHGGYWQAMDKGLFHFVADGFIEHEVTMVLVNYPLAPQASMDEIVESCSKAVIWLYRNGGEYNGDPDRMYVSGHSAGGHIVAMLLTVAWREIDEDLPVDLIKGGCAISGLFDLTPIRLSYLNDVLGLDEPTARRNSPVHLTPASKGSLIISVGEQESDEYHAQSRTLSTRWSQDGLSLTLMVLPNHDHFSILEQLAHKEAALNWEILKQMGNSHIPDHRA